MFSTLGRCRYSSKNLSGFVKYHIFETEKKQSSRQIAVLSFDGNREMFSIRHLAHAFLYLLSTAYIFFFLYRSHAFIFLCTNTYL